MFAGSVTQSTINADEVLQPYVPRLLISWLRETPEARHREVDGSLAFVDISGFTQLTERLSRKGKVGSEEISDTLDSCFGQLTRAGTPDRRPIVELQVTPCRQMREERRAPSVSEVVDGVT
jgi:hypothetical protein